MVSSFFFLYVVLLMCSSHNLFCSAATDTLTYGDQVIGDGSKSLVSSGEVFELGFFSPRSTEKGSSGADRRYVGIWYHKLTPKTVVWVANRDDPIPANSTGVLTIKDGNLCLLDDVTRKTTYWSTMIENSLSTNKIVKIMDSGNLVLMDTDTLVWQSFQNPTDTFIPGMKMDTSLILTSWKAEDDPKPGNFIFKQDKGGYQYIILKKLIPHWKGGDRGKQFSSDDMDPEVAYLLSNFSKSTAETYLSSNSSSSTKKLFNPYKNLTNSSDYISRLKMNFDGELQFLILNNRTQQWLPSWREPKDQCSVYNPCGSFGICNNNNRPLVCKCLPGFNPKYQDKWDSGDFSDGCAREESRICDNDTFLSLRMMKIGESLASSIIVDNETECRKECQSTCQCQAYSYAPQPIQTRGGKANTNVTYSCWTWLTDLNDLVEDYGGSGHNISVRVALSDIESTKRDCKPCGTTLIPYPLSTALDCGDPMYSRFNCNPSTGQVSFKGLNGTNFTVVRISPTTRRFIIQIPARFVENCDDRNQSQDQQLNPTPPFNVTNWCYIDDLRNFSSEVSMVELGWNLPLEPICNTTEDCRGWPNSICSPAEDGERRCKCNTSYRWNGQTLNCTGENKVQEPVNTEEMPPRRKDPLVWILLAVLTSVICLVCISFIFIKRKKMNKRRDQINRARLDSERQVKELIDTSELDEEDEKGLDVPFFDLQSILEATDNFSDANKLGQGGYGPVYKGKFAGGQEVAVKRLSRVSGQGLQEFKNEVVLIAKLQHRNLVRLRGYCMKGEEKILLYEYMSNKSLDSFIFDHAQSVLLNWEMRFNIILGIARGLLYLHQDSRLRIIHRDLKTSNILLDEEMNPKISDFGLARIVGGKETEANTATVVGTYGYMSPEYALDGTFSVKSDVFSFGVVLLEIISGKKNTGFYQSKQTFSLIGYAWELWTVNKVFDLMDKTLDESCNQNEFIKCVNVGLLCVQEDPSDRPTMSNVITLLDSEAANPPTPNQPVFLIRRGNSSTASSSTKPEITMTLEGR